jgi:DNA damage-binding protein 1
VFSVVGKFLPGQDTLIVWKSNRLEVFTLSEDGLVAVTECKLYGQIELAILFRAPGEVKDRLFVLTREHQILTLNVSENHVIEEVATGAIADAAGERARALAVIGEKMAALILNEGMLKVIPIDSKGLFQDAFNVRLPDRDVLALTLLAGTNTIVYLCCDGSDRRLLRSHTVSIKEKSLSEGPIADVMDKGASHLDSLGKGVLVGGELEVVWISGKTRVSAKFPSSERSRLLAMGRLDADGSRWLLSDESGHLWLLACTLAQGMVTRMQVNLRVFFFVFFFLFPFL